ncbi:MAG TPA: DUF3098 domain-containing protein [Sphingobacteriaceae bacterium]
MAQKNTHSTETNVEFVFGRSNYRLLLISIAMVVAGFILMMGETDIYDFRKTVIAPIVVLAGFAVGFFAILKKPDQSK